MLVETLYFIFKQQFSNLKQISVFVSCIWTEWQLKICPIRELSLKKQEKYIYRKQIKKQN